jgi:hypothetical protein
MILTIVPQRLSAFQALMAVSRIPRANHVQGTRRVRAKPIRKKKMGAATRPNSRHHMFSGSKKKPWWSTKTRTMPRSFRKSVVEMGRF